MATQLGIYQHALRLIGSRRVADLSEAREPRRVLDDAYSDVVAMCMAQGLWSFAMRHATISSAGAGLYGFSYSFTKPSDLIHLFMASETADFDEPLLYDFADDLGAWHANGQSLYVRYTSNDGAYGGNVTAWPQAFAFYVAAELALNVALRLTSSVDTAKFCEQLAQMRLENARAIYQVDGVLGLMPKNIDARHPVRIDGSPTPPRFRGFADMAPDADEAPRQRRQQQE